MPLRWSGCDWTALALLVLLSGCERILGVDFTKAKPRVDASAEGGVDGSAGEENEGGGDSSIADSSGEPDAATHDAPDGAADGEAGALTDGGPDGFNEPDASRGGALDASNDGGPNNTRDGGRGADGQTGVGGLDGARDDDAGPVGTKTECQAPLLVDAGFRHPDENLKPQAEAGTPSASPFPATQVLDHFNGSTLVDDWIDARDFYALCQGALGCFYCPVIRWGHRLGAAQEVFATLAGFGGDDVEIDLVLKAQQSSQTFDIADCERIEVVFSPFDNEIRIEYCANNDEWKTASAVPIKLAAGDQIGGRAHADGRVEVFVNGRVVSEAKLSDFAFDSGWIGVSAIPSNTGVVWIDDFGGGDLVE